MRYYLLLMRIIIKYIIDNIISMYEIMLIIEYWAPVKVNPSIPYFGGSDSIIAGNFKTNPVINIITLITNLFILNFCLIY